MSLTLVLGRRGAVREPVYEIRRVIGRERNGKLHAFPIMLRDRSEGGLGAVYVGDAPPRKDGEYYLEAADDSMGRLQLVWIAPLANHVYNIGFRLCPDGA